MKSIHNGHTAVTSLVFLGGTALCLAASTIIAKNASQIGLPPFTLLLWGIAGTAFVLTGHAIHRCALRPLSRSLILYLAVASTVSVVIPNLVIFATIPHAGIGHATLLIAIPPALTYAAALALRIERFSASRLVGVGAVIAGAFIIVSSKLGSHSAPVRWALICLLAPIALVTGDIYRSARWPERAGAELLAAGIMVFASLTALVLGASFALPLAPEWTGEQVVLVIAQAAVFSGQFILLFELQRPGGPVRLSLWGVVAALVAVPASVILFGDPLHFNLVYAAPLIVFGVGLVALGGRRATE